MKTLIFRGLIVMGILTMISTQMWAQEKKGARLEYKEKSMELGTLFTDDLKPVSTKIEFTNDGDEPLIITTARGCCGTRIKAYPREPIIPGEKAFIEIEFRLAPRPHNINRTISVMSNDERGMRVFRITGEVAERGS